MSSKTLGNDTFSARTVCEVGGAKEQEEEKFSLLFVKREGEADKFFSETTFSFFSGTTFCEVEKIGEGRGTQLSVFEEEEALEK